MPEILLLVIFASVIIGLSAWAADKWWAATHPKLAENAHEVADLFLPPQDPVYWCVAGNLRQSEYERTQFGIDRKHWRYISSPEVLRGENIDPELVIFTGAWDQRPDMEAVSRELLVATHKHAAKNSRLNTGWERP